MEVDNEEIYKWIDTYQLSRQKKNIYRDFADAVPLAEMLKHHFPKLVDLHNYSPRNSVSQKLINWTTLQRKVLGKLRVNLSKATLEELSRAEPGVIERVLWQVKIAIEKEKNKDKQDDVYYVEGLENDLNDVFPIKTKQGSKVTEQKIVPAHMYDNMTKSLEDKDKLIVTLNDKIEHLQKLVSVKDARIEDLKLQIKNLSLEEGTRISSRFINSIF